MNHATGVAAGTHTTTTAYTAIGRPTGPTGHVFWAAVAGLAGATTGYAVGVLQQRRWRARCARWAHIATHDPLTGLLNRRGWTDRMTTPRAGVIGILDLDGLKAVNDSQGHAAGDLLLTTAAARAAAVIAARAGLIARLGGDEFAIWLPAGCPPRPVADRLHKALSEPINHPALGRLRPAASLGVAELDTAGHGLALQRADAAMYRAKRDRLGTAYYDPHLDQHSHRARPRHRIRDQRGLLPHADPASGD